MQLLVTENFPGAAVKVLATTAHDVIWVRVAAPGSTDPDVLERPAREERILLAFDKDFGELARKSPLPTMPKPGAVGQRIANLITARDDWAGHFSVVEPGRVRMRPRA